MEGCPFRRPKAAQTRRAAPGHARRDGTAKIADVGMAKVLNRDYVTGVVSTLAWSAPEMLWGAKCTEKADIYSFGIVLWEICSGEAPERGRLRDLGVPEECPAEVRQLILECLEARPSLRPTALQLVERLGRAQGGAPAQLPQAPQAQLQAQPRRSFGSPGPAVAAAHSAEGSAAQPPAGPQARPEGQLQLAATPDVGEQAHDGVAVERQLVVGPAACAIQLPPGFAAHMMAAAEGEGARGGAAAPPGQPVPEGRGWNSGQPGTPHQTAPEPVQPVDSLELGPGMPGRASTAATATGEPAGAYAGRGSTARTR